MIFLVSLGLLIRVKFYVQQEWKKLFLTILYLDLVYLVSHRHFLDSRLSNISRPISSLKNKTKVLHSAQDEESTIDDPLPGPSSLKATWLTTTNKSRPISALDNVASYICVKPHLISM